MILTEKGVCVYVHIITSDFCSIEEITLQELLLAPTTFWNEISISIILFYNYFLQK